MKLRLRCVKLLVRRRYKDKITLAETRTYSAANNQTQIHILSLLTFISM